MRQGPYGSGPESRRRVPGWRIPVTAGAGRAALEGPLMYICYIRDMSDPVVESMAEVRSHLADVIDRARREETPTIITRRGKQEAVVIDIQEYQRLREVAENAEEAWLNQLADEAESEGTEGSVSLEEMAALLRAHQV